MSGVLVHETNGLLQLIEDRIASSAARTIISRRADTVIRGKRIHAPEDIHLPSKRQALENRSGFEALPGAGDRD